MCQPRTTGRVALDSLLHRAAPLIALLMLCPCETALHLASQRFCFASRDQAILSPRATYLDSAFALENFTLPRCYVSARFLATSRLSHARLIYALPSLYFADLYPTVQICALPCHLIAKLLIAGLLITSPSLISLLRCASPCHCCAILCDFVRDGAFAAPC